MNVQMQPFVLQVKTDVDSLEILLLEEPHGAPGLDEKCSPSSIPGSLQGPFGFVGQ